ncbi:unnamed protein product [Adineta steineri]|uniref:Atg6 BARA domain-containing protein n=1 Tax=Adineta steineri TaxID=433720 RepID=A0A815N7L9_9BILA|nr:unnamed protein product [Adineta steineri]
MKQIKRERSNSTNIYDKNKKQKIQDFHHVYQAFDSLNARFYNLITNTTLPIEVNLSSISKSTFKRYNKDIILPNKHRIHSLHLSNPCLYDDISSPIHILSQFLHLKTLSLNNIESKHLENLLPILVSLPCLSSLSITSIDIIVNRTAIYSQIIRLPALKYCSLSLKGSHYSEVPLPILDKYSPIEHLIIKHGISTNELYNLLSYISQLRRLYVCYILNSWTTYMKPSPFLLPYLTHVSLDLSSISFAVFEEMVIDIFHLVHVLHIFIRNNNDKMYTDANRWEQLILSYMRNLRIFDIRHETWSRNITTNNQVILNTPTNKFTSSFWSERQWFFTQQFIQERDRNCTIFCSIEPYRRKYYTLCKQIHPSTYLNSKKTHLQSVQHLRIDNENEIIDCKYYFPNVTTLTLENSLSCTLIKSRSLSLTKIIEILQFTPYIRTLIFESMPLYGVNYKSIQQNQTFQLVSNTNMITNVIFKQRCTLDKLQLFVALCSRIQHLTIGHDTKDLESIVRFLLKKRNENTSHLCSIRLVSTCPFFLTTLRTLIESETLLTDYILKKVGTNIYLWRYKIIPLGSHSYIEVLNERENEKFVQLPLYTSQRYLDLDIPFDKALVAFLDCVNQFKLAIESKNKAINSKNKSFCLPYKMNGKGIISDSNGILFSVKFQFNSQENWTKALKYMLTNLKWGLSWITSQLPDDMTTSYAIPSPSSPTVASPR